MKITESSPLRTACLFLLLGWPVFAGGLNEPIEVLDQKRIHGDYNNGDFDRVTNVLEGFMKRNTRWVHSDSVFIAKHLAVVYSANPDTREKGKFYMFRLLQLVPSAKLVDMFVSDEIDRIFEKVREEFLVRQRGFGVDSTQVSIPEKAPARGQPVRGEAEPLPRGSTGPETPHVAASKPAGKSNAMYWVAGGVGVAAAATLAFIYLDEAGKDPDKIYPVPK
jgi:hypothetical protein